MKYRKPIDLWHYNVQDRIMSGDLKFQPGQWLSCGDPRKVDKLCRYVSHNSKSINVVHWQGSGKATNDLFKARLKAEKRVTKSK